MGNAAEPVWINRPPPATEFAGIRLIRTGTGKTFRAVITSEHLTGAKTHFAHRRTQPCTGEQCSFCLDAVPARWHGYLSIFSTQSRTHNILELTALAAAPIADYDDRHGSLRGAQIEAYRTGNRPNSPVHVTLTPCDIDLRTLPHGVDVERFLCTLWSIPLNSTEEGENPPPRPNTRNSSVADPPTSSPQSANVDPAELRSPLHRGNGHARKDCPPDRPQCAHTQ